MNTNGFVAGSMLGGMFFMLTCADCAQAAGQYPAKPIRLVVAQAPGGAADIQMRLFAQKMSEAFGQQMIVDNRSGAGVAGINTLAMVAKANPDGYTIMCVSNNFIYTPALVKDFPLDIARDYAAVSMLARAPLLLVISPKLPVKSVKEFIALAKGRPDRLTVGASSIGTGTHLITMRLLTAAGINATYVPYKSAGLALIDLTAGRIDASMTSVISSNPHVKAGRLRALGISTAQRSTLLPDIPTIAEQGIPGFDASVFVGWVAPAKTPPAILNLLSKEGAKVVNSAAITEKLRNDGGEPVGSSPGQFKEFIAGEVGRWAKLIASLGITAMPE